MSLLSADSGEITGDSEYLTGRFRERLNRFVMVVELDETTSVEAFCPNTSRLIGLLNDGVSVLLTENNDQDRKTDYTIHAFRDNETWVGIDAARANDLFEEYLGRTSEDRYGSVDDWSREVTLNDSRIDFSRSDGDTRYWVEVKSLSSRGDDGDAFYSGTPSKRGYRHLEELGRAVEKGDRADCVFVVQRSDVEGLSPAQVTQRDWLDALRSAREKGVEILAYRCAFDGRDWAITERIPTRL